MEQRNLLLAIVISLAVIFGFQFLMEHLYPDRNKPVETTQPTTQQTENVPLPTAPSAGSGTTPAPQINRAQILAETQRIAIDNPAVDGSLSLVGGRIDDLKLKKYRETVDPDSPEVTLLSPSGTERPYYASIGWVANGDGLALPDSETAWTADGKTLTHETPITLTWDNGNGLVFTRKIAIDEHYMFEITQTVQNNGTKPVDLFPYSLISRTNPPPTLGYYILHEGPIGVLDGTLKEINYKDLKKDGSVQYSGTGGWIGITDKYWLVSLIPNQKASDTGRFNYSDAGGANHFQTDFLGAKQSIAPGQSATVVSHLFAGAKQVQLLDTYAEEYGIDKFDRAIDFGWFYFLTKPLFLFLVYIHKLVGNFGIAILVLTVIVKLLFFPLANKSYRSMSRMKALQPEIAQLRERFGDDKQRLNQEMMAMYKEKKINPASGCLPIVIQIPVFFSLYKVLFVTIEMRHAPFFGWIQNLSAPDPTTVFNLFGLIPWTPPHFLMIGAWPLIMGLSMFLQQRLNPQPPDPIQAKVFMFLPIIFTFLLARFPSGLVIYWAWNNTLSIAQQWVIMRTSGQTRKGTPPGTPAPAAANNNTSGKGGGGTKGAASESETGPPEATEPETAEAEPKPAERRTTTSAARGKNRGRNRRRSRGGRR